VVDKVYRGGRYYQKKGTVADVHPGGRCDVALDGSRLEVLQLHQSSLETVVPREEGGAVLVVAGRWRGQRARLLQRSAENNVAAVQLLADMSVQRLSMDDVAEFRGPLDEDEDR